MVQDVSSSEVGSRRIPKIMGRPNISSRGIFATIDIIPDDPTAEDYARVSEHDRVLLILYDCYIIWNKKLLRDAQIHVTVASDPELARPSATCIKDGVRDGRLIYVIFINACIHSFGKAKSPHDDAVV